MIHYDSRPPRLREGLDPPLDAASFRRSGRSENNQADGPLLAPPAPILLSRPATRHCWYEGRWHLQLPGDVAARSRRRNWLNVCCLSHSREQLRCVETVRAHACDRIKKTPKTKTTLFLDFGIVYLGVTNSVYLLFNQLFLNKFMSRECVCCNKTNM